MIEPFRKLLGKYANFSQLRKNVFSGGVYSVVNILITLISYPIYLKFLGVEKYGLWVTVSAVLIFSQLGQMGIGVAITKYVAGEYGKKNSEVITEYISTSFVLLLIPSVITFCIFYFYSNQLAGFLRINEIFGDVGSDLIFWVGILSIINYFVLNVKGVVVGIGRLDIANYTFLIGRIAQICIAVALLLSGFGVWSLYYGFIAYYIIPFIYWVFLLRVTYKIEIFKISKVCKNRALKLIKFGGMLSVGQIARMLVDPFNKIVIARYVGLPEVAYYQIAFQVIMFVRSIFVKGLEAFVPKVSELKGAVKNSFDSITSIHQKGMKFIGVCALPSYLVFFIFAELILWVWLQDEYNAQIAMVLRILIVGWAVNTLIVPDYFTFIGIGKPRYSVMMDCMFTAINIVLIITMISLRFAITLQKIVVINSISLIIPALFLKIQYYKIILSQKGQGVGV